MKVIWTDAALAELEARDIEPALVQHAILAPDEVEPGPPRLHSLRYWDLGANREMWLRVRIQEQGGSFTVLGAEKRPVYTE